MPALRDRIAAIAADERLEGVKYAYALKPLNGFEWQILELKIENGKVVDVKTAPPSIREVVCNRLVTMLERGDTIESLA